MLVLATVLAGCSSDTGPAGGAPSGTTRAGTTQSVLRLATTTSTRDSGLLDELLPGFEAAEGCRVDVIAVGTGAALKLGESGDVDVLMVHAREAELAFMAAGHGTRHEEFMENAFVILGPTDDPAGVRDVPPEQALRKIAASGQRFLSRGDDSGTHQRELILWKAAGGRPGWDGYLESGQGMGPTLVMADEMRAYVLADRGTYLRFRGKIDLEPLPAAADSLRNPYASIVVNPDKHAKTDNRLANAFVDFLTAPATQQQIADFRIEGQALFRPTRLDAALSDP